MNSIYNKSVDIEGYGYRPPYVYIYHPWSIFKRSHNRIPTESQPQNFYSRKNMTLAAAFLPEIEKAVEAKKCQTL